MKKIEPDYWYRPQDEELRQIGAIQTLSMWRFKEVGPKFTKSGSRVLYKGEWILEFLDQGIVSTKAA